MNFSEQVPTGFRGEFYIQAKNKKGEIVYEYEDRNVVVNDARPVTAYLLCPFVDSGAERPEFDNDGVSVKTEYEFKKINTDNFKISFLKLGSGFPRKRSYCDGSSVEHPLVPNELDTDIRSSLFAYLDYYSTLTDTIPTDWKIYGEANDELPHKASSLLYPRKTDTDIYDRDYQWSKRIMKYNFPYPVDSPNFSFRATFETTMRFDEGNGPIRDALGEIQTEEDRTYEYREAGLFVGVQPWMYAESQLTSFDGAESSLRPDSRRVVGDIFGALKANGTLDSTLSNNLREYRFWDGHSKLVSDYSSGIVWPKETESTNWQSSIAFRQNFKSVYVDASSLSVITTSTQRQGSLYQGHYMVARKTFPVITKTKDIEFSIRWSLVFG